MGGWVQNRAKPSVLNEKYEVDKTPNIHTLKHIPIAANAKKAGMILGGGEQQGM